MFDLLIDICKTFLVLLLSGSFERAPSSVTNILPEWWFLSVLLLVGMFAMVIIGCLMSRLSSSVEEDEGIELWSRVATRTYVAMALSSAVLHFASGLPGARSPFWYSPVLSGFTFVSGYFVYKAWRKQD
nr:hypothetical protein [Candidatus Njordarchaeum guaymaensis]